VLAGGEHPVDVQLTAVDARSGRSADVVLVVEKDSTVADAARALRAALGLPDTVEGLRRRLRPDLRPPHRRLDRRPPGRPVLPMTVSPLREARWSVWRARRSRRARPDVGGVAEVRVVGGPDAGRVHRLPLGEFVLGAPTTTRGLRGRRLGRRPAGPAAGHPAEVRWTPYDGRRRRRSRAAR
jgi:S-DNA-T family DNA segregation ATPase FtsK/SpoIIIE